MKSSNTSEENPIKGGWTGYWSMIVQQTQNAFNDKAAQFFLISLGGAIAFTVAGTGVESVAGMMIALPFVLFAPLAGWVSDRFSKRNVIILAAISQVLILSLMCFAVTVQSMALALVGFFLLAIQSAFFSPAKMGINKELVGSKNLGFAAGVQQMMAMLAILSGQILAGWWYDHRYVSLGSVKEKAWDAALFPIFLITAGSVFAVGMAFLIPKVKARGSEPLSPRILIGYFKDLNNLWAEIGLRRASFGVAFFWGFAAFVNLWSVKVAKYLTDGGEGFGTLSSLFMGAASLGLAIGFGLSAYVLRNRIELGWVPPAAMLMLSSLVVLVFIPMDGTAFLITIAIASMAGGLFLSPLNAWMQDNYPADKRGEMQSAVNLQDCLAGLGTIILIELMLLATRAFGMGDGLGFRLQMAAFALISAGMVIYFSRLYLSDTIRMFGLWLIKKIYKIELKGAERIPGEGGVLLLPNHVSFADAFFLSACSERRVRFVMDEAFMKHPAIRFSAQLFGTVPIRQDQPLEAIRLTIKALEDGDVVALFPEGQLTRTGGLSQIERGFELIARKTEAPILPIWVDGSWGSIFSFERGRFFKKKPYRVPYGLSVAIGEPLSEGRPKVREVQEALLKASAAAITGRCGDDVVTRNAHQLTQLSAIPRGADLNVMAGEKLEICEVLKAFAELTGGLVKEHDKFSPSKGIYWLGGDSLKKQILAAGKFMEEIAYYDFSIPNDESTKFGEWHYSCFSVGKVIVSMSMGHPKKSNESNHFQSGNKDGSLGKLLPGFFVEDGEIQPGGFPLPAGYELDSESFLVPSSAGV